MLNGYSRLPFCNNNYNPRLTKEKIGNGPFVELARLYLMQIRDDLMGLAIAAALVAVLLFASTSTYFDAQHLPPIERVFANSR
jgi:hypothetical protein